MFGVLKETENKKQKISRCIYKNLICAVYAQK